MFGEMVFAESFSSHFEGFPELQLHVVRPPAFAAGDENTIEFEYVRIWREGDLYLQSEVSEFVTFTECEPIVARMGYIKPPSTPVKVVPPPRPAAHREQQQRQHERSLSSRRRAAKAAARRPWVCYAD
jgi:hypothetical protein